MFHIEVSHRGPEQEDKVSKVADGLVWIIIAHTIEIQTESVEDEAEDDDEGDKEEQEGHDRDNDFDKHSYDEADIVTYAVQAEEFDEA